MTTRLVGHPLRPKWWAVVVLSSVAIGLVTAWSFGLALALAEVLLFAIMYRQAQWSVLIFPAAWVLFADPTFLGQTGLSSLSSVYRALDLWTLLAFGAFTLSLFVDRQSRQIMREPISLGIVSFWSAFALAALCGGIAAPSSRWVGEVRSILAVGWFFLTVSIVGRGSGSSRQVSALFTLVIIGMIVKGAVYWFTGRGAMDASAAAGYRAFGSEEATAGLLALAAGTGAITAGKKSGRWPMLTMLSGMVLLLVSALRAFWIAAALMMVVILAINLVSAPRGAWRILLALGALISLVGVALAVGGKGLYQASIAPRLSTFGSLTTLLTNDESFAYRMVEWATVQQAVGGRILVGSGLGAVHRGVYFFNPSDPELWIVLAGYVHNSFLWAFLKAGLLGVSGVAALYLGFFAESLSVGRRQTSRSAKMIAWSFAAAVLALVAVGLFNAHIAEVRYMMIVGPAFGMLVGQSPLDHNRETQNHPVTGR